MRRNVLVLALAAISGLALGAPAVYAAPSPCSFLATAAAGKSFAILITGGEFQGNSPLLAQPNPTPIVGVGVIEIVDSAPSSGACPVTGELIYNDNDTITGPASCTVGGGAVAYAPPGIPTPTPVAYSGSVPCFDGANTHLSGQAVVNVSGQGNITFTDTPSGKTFSFTIAQGIGGSYFVGTSAADESQNPDINPLGTPPAVLSVIGEKQGTPSFIQPYPTAWGTAPWFGETTVTCPGYGTADSTQTPGGYGGVAGATQVNANGSAGGWDSFNSNNNYDTVPATTLPNDLCYDTLVGASGAAPGTNAQDGPFSDGTVNVAASFTQPYTGQCYYTNLAGGFSLSAAAWGSKLTATYAITTGSTSALTGGVFAAPGGADYCEQQPAATGKRKLPVKVAVPKPETIPLPFLNTAGEDCLVGITLSDGTGSTSTRPGTGDFATDCSVAQAAVAQNDGGTAAGVLDVYPGYTPLTAKTDPGAIMLTCTSKSAVDGIITVASPNCAEYNGTVPAPN